MKRYSSVNTDMVESSTGTYISKKDLLEWLDFLTENDDVIMMLKKIEKLAINLKDY